MKASIITIGTEILIGQIIDTNSAYLGEKLGDAGVDVVSRFAISDIKKDMIDALSRAQEDSDLVILTGGLGPTKDDITKVVLAEYFGREMYYDESQFKILKAFFKQLGRETTKAHENQCYFPEGVTFLANELGTAPGMLFTHEDTQFISMPGVPYEMKSIFDNHVLPMILAKRENFLIHYTIQTAGQGESVLAEMIEDIEDNLPSHMALAYLPSLGKVRIRVSGSGKDEEKLEQEVNEVAQQIISRMEKYVFGKNEDTLESTLGELLAEKGLTIGCAESCTGGSISRLIASVPGSSRYFEGSIVSYSNELKEEILGVKKNSLIEHGAVSQQVVEEMIDGALKILGTDCAIAVSGIAGPTGGTPTKPVGTIFVGVGNAEKKYVKKLQLTKNRDKNIEYTSYAAMNLMRLFILDLLEE